VNGVNSANPVSELSRSRKILLWSILLLIATVLPLVLLEVGLRVAGVRVSDDPYLQFGRVDSFFTRREIEGRDYYEVASRDVYREREVRFPVVKDRNTFRVFCLGSSASAGWPHPASEIYSVYLQEALQRAHPDRQIEVINVSAHAYPAYRSRMIFKEVINFEPDLLVIYAGNNEFIERRTYQTRASWLDPLVAVANRSHLYRVLRGSPYAKRFFPENTLQAEEREHVRYEQWSKLEQLALELRKDPQQFARVKEHYRYSIESMVTGAAEKGVPVILVTIPVNLQDWRPNVSYQALEGAALERWQPHYRRGRAALLRGEWDDSITELERAIALNPEHAESYFHLGHALQGKGEHAAALERFTQARDLDYNPFRAISDFNATLRDIAAQHANAELADAALAFEAASVPQAPGFELLLDYVHPTKRGNLLVAKTVFDALDSHRLLGAPGSAEFSHEPRPYFPDGSAYEDERDVRMQAALVHLFVMMHQDEGIVAKGRYLMETAETLPQEAAAEIQEAMEVYPKLIDLEHREYLGGEVAAGERERLEERLQAFYRRFFPGYDEYKRYTERTSSASL
jgi:tetratricopeptide (TPR) repeat protein